jgi:hypothetical protein
MEKDDPELEKYLSEFQARRVRPLELPQPGANAWLRRLAAAALVLFSVGGGLWYAEHERKLTGAEVRAHRVGIESHMPESEPNSIPLTKLALEDPKRFEQQLDAQSRRVLPDLQGQQSTLRVFAEE